MNTFGRLVTRGLEIRYLDGPLIVGTECQIFMIHINAYYRASDL